MKRYKRRWIIIFLIIFIVCFWIFRYFRSENISTQIARAETYEDKIVTNAVLVRNETVYTTQSGGIILGRVTSGAKVGRGAYIANVYHGSLDDSARQEIEEINQRINALKKAGSGTKSFSSDIGAVESEIKNGINDIVSLSIKNDLTNLDTAVLNLEEKMNLGRGSIVESMIEQLDERRNQIEQSIAGSSEKIHASDSGVFIPFTDGYESVFSVDGYDEITLDKIDECIQNANGAKEGEVFSYNPGDGVCKVSDNTSWMLACRLKKEDIYGIKQGGKVQVRLLGESDFVTDASVVKLFSDDGENYICILEAGSYFEAAYLKRVCEAEIIKNSYSGLAIPAEALRFDKDGTSGVYINYNGVAKFRKVNVLYSDDKIAVVENKAESGAIKMYDNVILDRDGIYDGKNIR